MQNAFAGKAKPPTEKELSATLGPSKAGWDKLLHQLWEELALRDREWNSYSIKAGWALRIKSKGRNIVYLSPGDSGFVASFALGERAMATAYACGLPKKIVKILKEAKRYA